MMIVASLGIQRIGACHLPSQCPFGYKCSGYTVQDMFTIETSNQCREWMIVGINNYRFTGMIM